MGYLITPRGIKELDGRWHQVEYKDKIMTARELAAEIGQSQPCITGKIRKVVAGEITYNQLVSNDSLAGLNIKHGRTVYNVTQVVELTGYSRPVVTRRFRKFIAGDCNIDVVLCKKPVVEKPQQIAKAPKRKPVVEKKKAYGSIEEKDDDYRERLRQHKMNTAPVYGGCN